ncbi:MarR family transcriptional regulator [Agromyces sp. ISL-38]|uniref:MarR family winged helix-turn-helix transcriptional regulator n=1 Tax=Agromyces sp. ISL-38 TaxID=2819107 RepID=UPI001BEA824E|nr:MarR family transcriptional regulator [Agromyces sp. ISL-38]MBT2499536.1 MarR family transcriptional regulator [Agromyces sp. ISL-38]MBT2516333.1 MarR family transcriptional regulator [Streptomyces sp. ISL-90]
MAEKSTRDREIERAGEVMREFMARAVLFQEAVAKWGGLNSTDLQCASLLMSQGPATPGELADRAGLTAGGGITTAIDRLERAGFVTRERDPNDRRRVIVTANSGAILERFGEVYGRVGARWNDYLETLSDEQLAFANELFSRAAELNRDEIDRLRGQ